MNGRSYSDINTYQRCPKKYEYRVLENLQRKVQNIDLFNGINAHEFLKWFFLALQAGATVEEALTDVQAQAHILIEAERHRTFEDELTDAVIETELILSVIERYCRQYGEEWTILHVEEEFLTILDSGDVVTFTPDLVVQDRNGAIWIVDHKTTSRKIVDGIPFGDMQALLYYAGVKSLYPQTVGFMFNRLRKKLPTQPRLTKTGKTRVADVARIDTTYELLRDFLTEKAPGLLSEPSHQRRLAELRDQGNTFFWTEQVYVNDETVANVLEDVRWVLGQIKESERIGYFPRHLLESNGYKDCRKCPFQPLCRGEMLGWDVAELRETEYEPRDPKNPYETEEDDE